MITQSIAKWLWIMNNKTLKTEVYELVENMLTAFFIHIYMYVCVYIQREKEK